MVFSHSEQRGGPEMVTWRRWLDGGLSEEKGENAGDGRGVVVSGIVELNQTSERH